MKQVVNFGGGAIQTIAWTRGLAAIPTLALAIATCRAARHYEQQGFEFTAAMAWRKAAGSLSLIPFAANLCWKQWERVMHLPRRLAEPIGGPAPVLIESVVSPRLQPAPMLPDPVDVRVPLASAA